MVARSVPEVPSGMVRAERRVWEALRASLPDGSVLLPGLRFRTDKGGDGECDLLVLVPDVGAAMMEVKGNAVWREDGAWCQRLPNGDAKRIHPLHQAQRAKYDLQGYLDRQPEWTHGRMRRVHMVAFPDVPWGDHLEGPDVVRSMALTQEDLADASGPAARVLQCLRECGTDDPAPDASAVELAARLLGGRMPPQRRLALTTIAQAEHVDALTREQADVLDQVRDNSRIEVIGGPGSGKTWLALEQTRRLAEDGRRVALLCFSRGLSLWLQRAAAGWSERARRNAHIGTFHSLGVSWGAAVIDAHDPHFWEEVLPERMLELATALDDGERFDAVVVDEAQDFADSWWPPVLAALRDPLEGGLYVFGDAGQGVFGREGRPRTPLFKLRLDANVRNTRQIVETFRSLGAERPEVLGGEGRPALYVECGQDEVYDEADRVAVRLLEEGWRPEDIVVLTTNHQHPMQKHRIGEEGRDGYWAWLWDGDDYFYATVPGFKGLERPVVVLAVDGFRDPELAREVLYVGLSRARDLLVVVGDLDVIGAAGGKELRKRLDRARAWPELDAVTSE